MLRAFLYYRRIGTDRDGVVDFDGNITSKVACVINGEDCIMRRFLKYFGYRDKQISAYTVFQR